MPDAKIFFPSLDNFTQFSNVAHELAESRHNAIFVDECVYYKKSTDKLLDLLEEHVKKHVIKAGIIYTCNETISNKYW